jgi:hexokinase
MTALINDTTGTLIASNYVDPNTKIACIFGTGCNAAYMEQAGNIPKMDKLGLAPEQDMAINVRSGRGRAKVQFSERCRANLRNDWHHSVNGVPSIRSTTNTCVSIDDDEDGIDVLQREHRD